MNFKKLILTSLFVTLGAMTSLYAQCTNCDTTSRSITNNQDGTFTSVEADAYFWKLCDSVGTIQNSNLDQTVEVVGTSGSFSIGLVRFKDGKCIESCLIVPDPNPTCGVEAGQPTELNLFNDGHLVFQAAGTILDSGWTIQSISFKLTYQNGSVINYAGFIGSAGVPQTSPIYVPDCDNNKVVEAEVSITVTDGTTTCTDTEINRYKSGGVCGTEGLEFGDDDDASNLKIYPNPASDVININKAIDAEMIEIFDLTGEVHLQKPLNQTKALDTSSLEKGIYFMRIVTKNGDLLIEKLIIK